MSRSQSVFSMNTDGTLLHGSSLKGLIVIGNSIFSVLFWASLFLWWCSSRLTRSVQFGFWETCVFLILVFIPLDKVLSPSIFYSLEYNFHYFAISWSVFVSYEWLWLLRSFKCFRCKWFRKPWMKRIINFLVYQCSRKIKTEHKVANFFCNHVG